MFCAINFVESTSHFGGNYGTFVSVKKEKHKESN